MLEYVLGNNSHNADKASIVPSRNTRLIVYLVIIAALGVASLIVYQSSVAVKKDQFYLSVGLYADYTHDCYYHNPATCEAQFKAKQVKYSVKSLNTSYVDSGVSVTTSKGWLDFYLPGNQKYLAEFEVEGLKGSGVMSTEEEAPSCISTIKVSK